MGTIRVRDDVGTIHEFAAPPRRIVSLVPSLTESVIALGGADRLVGVTEWCIRPEDVVKSIPKVRGTKNPYIQKILELEPDLVLANHEENRERHVAELRRYVPVFLTYPRTVFDALKTLKDLGQILAVSEHAGELIETCEFLLDGARQKSDPYFHTACLIWRDPWMVVGHDTYTGDLLGQFGLINVFREDDGRYPETSLETLAEREPEVVLLPNEPFEFEEQHKDEVQSAIWKSAPGCRVVLLEGSFLTWWGARTLPALTYLSEIRRDLCDRNL